MERPPKPKWTPGSFLDNFNATALHLGYDQLPLAWHLAKVNWKSTQDRDTFLKALVEVQPGTADITSPVQSRTP